LWWRDARHARGVLEPLLAAAVFPAEAQCGGEDGAPSLSSLDGAGCKALAVTYPFNVIHDRDLGVARQDEVAVHAVHREIARDSSLGGGQALGNHGTAVDAASSWGMPEGPCICEDILSGRQQGVSN
jgi:hypothetical protein